MKLANQKFTIRQVAEIHGERIPTLQSWADKGWARITPAPGPGQARELSIVDAYGLSIAIAFNTIGVEPRVANQIAFSAIHYGDTFRRATERTWRELGTTCKKYLRDDPTRQLPEIIITFADLDPAFHNRETVDPYHLFAKAGLLSCHPSAAIVAPYISTPRVDLIQLRRFARENPDQFAAELAAGALSDFGFFINLTDLIYAVDSALLAFQKRRDEERHDAINRMARMELEAGTSDKVVLPEGDSRSWRGRRTDEVI